ncbi:MAG TPA: polyphosphate kinase 2 family protein [Actinomycetota bacterium]|nr:polyphosphate kinase 2 family protein [Actinomycetota bacterium]
MGVLSKDVLERLRVEPGGRARLEGRDPRWKGGATLKPLLRDGREDDAREHLRGLVEGLSRAQERLWSSDRYAVLVIFQAMDAAGKDGTIDHVFSGVNPQGVHVSSFKQPSAEELDHDFLWRCATRLPQRGRIGVFNRSYYEEVLVVRVHPEYLDAQRLPDRPSPKRLWKQRYESINALERHLDRNGTKVVKFFLHVSKREQRERFLARLDDPDKRWKFSARDVDERAFWDDYQRAYEDAISATSTRWAPWYVIPADHKFVMRALVAGVLVDTLHGLRLEFPIVSEEQAAELDEARRRLEAE